MRSALMAGLPDALLQLVEAVGHRIALIDAARACRARAMALDDGHRRVVRQLAPQFKFGLEVADLPVERVALVVHGLDCQLVGCHVGLFLAGEQRALEQQCLLQHRRKRHLGREAPRQQVLVRLVAQLSMTPRVIGSDVLPASRKFSKVVLRTPETSSCKTSSLASYSSWISGVS